LTLSDAEGKLVSISLVKKWRGEPTTWRGVSPGNYWRFVLGRPTIKRPLRWDLFL
jgi:hypothetical protein